MSPLHLDDDKHSEKDIVNIRQYSNKSYCGDTDDESENADQNKSSDEAFHDNDGDGRRSGGSISDKKINFNKTTITNAECPQISQNLFNDVTSYESKDRSLSGAVSPNNGNSE